MFYRGCKGINSNLYYGNFNNSYFRVMNILPCGADVDVYVNGKLMVQNLSHKQVSSYWAAMEGKYNVKVYPRGERVNPMLDTVILIQKGYILNLVIMGYTNKPKLFQVEEGVIRLQGRDPYVRFVNLSPTSQEMDIVILDKMELFRNIRNEEATNYKTIPSGVYTFNACASGTNHLLASIRNVQLNPNNYYTVYVIKALGTTNRLQMIMVNEPR